MSETENVSKNVGMYCKHSQALRVVLQSHCVNISNNNKWKDQFGEVLVPTEEVVENVAGKRRKSERKFFPGYVLVEMAMNDDTWHLVKSVPRVMGFIGGTPDKPAPISKREADLILNRLEQSAENHVIVKNINLVRKCV